MYSSKFSFIANSHSLDIEVSGKDEEETLKNQYGQYLLKVIDEVKETGNPNLD